MSLDGNNVETQIQTCIKTIFHTCDIWTCRYQINVGSLCTDSDGLCLIFAPFFSNTLTPWMYGLPWNLDIWKICKNAASWFYFNKTIKSLEVWSLEVPDENCWPNTCSIQISKVSMHACLYNLFKWMSCIIVAML